MKTYFSHPYISYMANEKLQGEEQFHSKNYLLEMHRSHAKMRLKSAPRKLNFIIAKAISKSYAIVCTAANALVGYRIVTHSATVSFSTKITLCETNNILFSKNYSKLGKTNARF